MDGGKGMVGEGRVSGDALGEHISSGGQGTLGEARERRIN